jgi:hypothetical protein
MHPVPFFLSSLLQRTRVGILMLLLVVLPLQSVAQLVAGVQGHRHVHTGSLLTALVQPLQQVLDRQHAAQDPRLAGVSRGAADGWHAHSGVLHRHSAQTHDAVDVGDAGDEARQAGATAFLAWLPTALVVVVGPSAELPPAAATDWRGRFIAPPRG